HARHARRLRRGRGAHRAGAAGRTQAARRARLAARARHRHRRPLRGLTPGRWCPPAPPPTDPPAPTPPNGCAQRSPPPARALRGCGTGAGRQCALAVALAAEPTRGGAWLVINDRVDLALATAARAAQLTSRSLSMRQARTLAPAAQLKLGASVHDPNEANFAC